MDMRDIFCQLYEKYSSQLFSDQPASNQFPGMRVLFRRSKYFSHSASSSGSHEAQKLPQGKLVDSLRYVFAKTSSPQFLEQRMKHFNHIKSQNQKLMAQAEKREISIMLKNGEKIVGTAFQTTPLTIARSLSRSLAQNSLVARVKYINKLESPFGKGVISAQAEQSFTPSQQYQLIDLSRPLEGDCTLQLINFEDSIGKQVFWHSSSHLLGQSLQNTFGAWLCHGPPVDSGYFYDSYIGDYRISQTDYELIEKQIKKSVHSKQAFERVILTKQQALEMFSYNPFKQQLIKSKIPQNGFTTAYRCGNLIDLCTGPHIPSADRVKGFKVIKNSSAYWLGNKQNDDLQRVYGISFPKQSQLDEYLKLQEELSKKDHRSIGARQQLFNISNLSPGSALFFPHGTIIYNRLIELMRSQYQIRGYSEVITPNIFHTQLWKMSGHYYKYKQNIFFVKEENGEEHGLKPMNCPGHCLMFDLIQRSYRDLPIRMADFGVLHRNQLHGALTGLTRVRRFQQDDAHIFCTSNQIESEILGVLDLLDYIYSIFGFKYVLELSTRPKQYLGDIEDWNKAEEQLKEALIKFGKTYKINQGDGAFYGPKIDIKLFDVYGREHQCGTIQLDFQLPVRFNLQYRSSDVKQNADQQNKIVTNSTEKLEIMSKTQQDQKKFLKAGNLKHGFVRPVIIHRAIFGSLQRFIAILCENTGGKWDFWISPRQIKILTVTNDSIQFAEKVYNTLLLKGYSVEIDQKNDKLSKKIRKAQMEGFNFIGVIGSEESKLQMINIRKRDESAQIGKMTIDQLLSLFDSLRPPKSKKRIDLEMNSCK